MSKISSADLQRLAQIVREETGNVVQERNYSMLESRISTHMLKLGIKTIQDYWELFRNHEAEQRKALQSLMTTHHTFFFREYLHFEALETWITDHAQFLKNRFAKNQQPFRIWSAACSRGQEVYSLAMFLEVHLKDKLGVNYEIVGSDIDQESIAYAKNGVYPITEVNTIPQMYLSRFWKKGTGKIKDFAAIQPALKANLKFESMNLLEIPASFQNSKFDVIFCRNVFIYFSDENIQKIALDLVKSLAPDGLFVSGISEPLRFASWKLKSIGSSCYQQSQAPVASVNATGVKTTSVNTTNPEVKAHAPAIAPLVLVGKTSPSEKSEAKPQSKYRVLCVDDSATIQLLIKKIFSQDELCAGVDTADNGNQARQKLDLGKYDVITLDIHMPEVNGIEFLERLYNRKTDPPVLMVSSVNRTDMDLATKSLSLGAFDYVEKPAMNNLQKSADEILTKAKMALRSKRVTDVQDIGSFDSSLSQKIVIPDASACLRIATASSESMKLVEQVVLGQKNEYRSPALLIVWTEDSSMTSVEQNLLKWTDRKVVSLREAVPILKPNHVYLTNLSVVKETIEKLKLKSVSLQILNTKYLQFEVLKKCSNLQVLVDESLTEKRKMIEAETKLHLSDITPATSFSSLSAEFFVDLRKSAA